METTEYQAGWNWIMRGLAAFNTARELDQALTAEIKQRGISPWVRGAIDALMEWMHKGC